MFRFIRQFIAQLAEAGTAQQEASMTTLDSEDALAACLAESHEKPLFVLKHSTRCPVSSSALGEVRSWVNTGAHGEVPVYINYVVEDRPVSNLLAETLGVRHESPQLLLLSKGKALWNASHGGITERAMDAALKSLPAG